MSNAERTDANFKMRYLYSFQWLGHFSLGSSLYGMPRLGPFDQCKIIPHREGFYFDMTISKFSTLRVVNLNEIKNGSLMTVTSEVVNPQAIRHKRWVCNHVSRIQLPNRSGPHCWTQPTRGNKLAFACIAFPDLNEKTFSSTRGCAGATKSNIPEGMRELNNLYDPHADIRGLLYVHEYFGSSFSRCTLCSHW